MADLRSGPNVALITGAGSGIGRACAHLFCERGWLVVAVDRDRAGLDATVASQRGSGRVCAHVADVTDAAGMRDAVSSATRLGPLRSVVAAAALGDTGGIDE